jgi:hypothetical protein
VKSLNGFLHDAADHWCDIAGSGCACRHERGQSGIVANPRRPPKKVVLPPPQVFVYELSAGGVPSRMADWEATARDNLTAAATRLARESGLFELVPVPQLAAADLDQLDAHIGLYDRVAQSVFVYDRGEQAAWAHKKSEFSADASGRAFSTPHTSTPLPCPTAACT